MGKSIDPIRLVPEMRDAELLNSTLRPIVSMSFQLAIPWRVALPQSPPPLHQPGAIMHERTAAGHQKPANGQLCLNYLSHPRGHAHLPSCHMAQRRFWRVEAEVSGRAKEVAKCQPSAGGTGKRFLLTGVRSNDCSYAPSGASRD